MRLFDARGRELKAKLTPDALKFSVDGPGSITSDGTYIAPKEAKPANALVTCKFGELTGTARVRITPPLPWKFDFNDGDVPLTWIGGRVRFEPREANGEKYIAKKTKLPTPKDPNNKLGTRSFVWMGPIDLSNYTIQGDVLLKKDEASGKISDVGLINGRYQLTIRGLSKKLRLDSWTTSDYRTHTAVDFDPVPDTWYTLKLRVVPGEKEAQGRRQDLASRRRRTERLDRPDGRPLAESPRHPRPVRQLPRGRDLRRQRGRDSQLTLTKIAATLFSTRDFDCFRN